MEDLQFVQNEMMKISCPICGVFPVNITLIDGVQSFVIACSHADDFHKKLDEVYLNLMKLQRQNL